MAGDDVGGGTFHVRKECEGKELCLRSTSRSSTGGIPIVRRVEAHTRDRTSSSRTAIPPKRPTTAYPRRCNEP